MGNHWIAHRVKNRKGYILLRTLLCPSGMGSLTALAGSESIIMPFPIWTRINHCTTNARKTFSCKIVGRGYEIDPRLGNRQTWPCEWRLRAQRSGSIGDESFRPSRLALLLECLPVWVVYPYLGPDVPGPSYG